MVSDYIKRKSEFIDEDLVVKWASFLEGKPKETDSKISSHVSGELTDDEIQADVDNEMEYFLDQNKKEEDPVGYMKKVISSNKNPNKKCFHLFKLVD